jgi:hypothetical protein
MLRGWAPAPAPTCMAYPSAQDQSSYFTGLVDGTQPHGTEDNEHSLNYPDGNSKLCSICEDINFHALFFQSKTWRGDSIGLGNIEDIISRSMHCTLCSIVHEVVFQTRENWWTLSLWKADSKLMLNPIREGRWLRDFQVIALSKGTWRYYLGTETVPGRPTRQDYNIEQEDRRERAGLPLLEPHRLGPRVLDKY